MNTLIKPNFKRERKGSSRKTKKQTEKSPQPSPYPLPPSNTAALPFGRTWNAYSWGALGGIKWEQQKEVEEEAGELPLRSQVD